MNRAELEEMGHRPIAGHHKCEGERSYPSGSYEIWADRSGTIYCADCGAYDLLPRNEALTEAHGSLAELEKFERRLRKEVLRGHRSPPVLALKRPPFPHRVGAWLEAALEGEK